MVIGLEDGIPIDHTGAAIAHHPPEGHVFGEFQVANAAPHDMGVTTSDELNNFCIIDQGETGHLSRILPKECTVDIACSKELLVDQCTDIETIGKRDIINILLLSHRLIDVVALRCEASQDVRLGVLCQRNEDLGSFQIYFIDNLWVASIAVIDLDVVRKLLRET